MTENQDTASETNQKKKLDLSTEELDARFGYDLYPERQKNQKLSFKNFWNTDKSLKHMYNCEKTVVNAISTNPVLKLFMGAFKKSGCEVDLRRHVSCEYCSPLVHGGYDPLLNQVVICYNTTQSPKIVAAVLIHEFIHMYDFCTRKADFTNLEHLVCSEIRAANLTYCTYMSWVWQKFGNMFPIKKMHRQCVKNRAVDSVLAVRAVPPEKVREVADRIFDKCYADMEPIGRRIRNKKIDPDLIYAEGFIYGYD